MQTSRAILESLERVLTSPSWAYSIWYGPVLMRSGPRRPQSPTPASEQSRN